MTMNGAPVAPDPAGAEHLPVLLREVIQGLQLGPGATSIDGTLGGGGHTAALLEASAPDGRLLALDADPAAIRRVSERLAAAVASGRLRLVQANFVEMTAVAQAQGFSSVDAILLDLGVSSFQLETAARGFSFLQDGPLDMRFDPDSGPSAADIVNTWDERELADMIYRYGEERRSRRIAAYLVRHRPFETTAQLAVAVEKAVGGRRGERLHPATRTFQALRIAVNRELEHLEEVLPQCRQLLRRGGRLAVISFHSLEDRIVKHWMQAGAQDFQRDPHHLYGGYPVEPALRIVTRKPTVPGKEETERNPRSRSAKLRIAERL